MTLGAVLAVIPARKDSKGIPRKNVRFLAGRPLVSYAIESAKGSRLVDHLVVSTDDEEIMHIAEVAGVSVVVRPGRLSEDDVPLDPVIHHAVRSVEQQRGERFETVITLEPTSPLLSSHTIDQALARFEDSALDTLISAVDDRHLAWTWDGEHYKPVYTERVNRQFLPPHFRETGGFVITRRAHVTPTSRFGPEVGLYELTAHEAIDINTPMDWWLAEKLLFRRRILLRADGYDQIGLGHVYRALMLAGRLIDHEILFVSHRQHRLGVEMIRSLNYPCRTFDDPQELDAIIDDFAPDIIINDVLDTDAAYIERLRDRGLFVVNFEDMGPGARDAHVVINALYERGSGSLPLEHSGRQVWGSDFYCLREEFLLLAPRPVCDRVQRVLVTFGGTDPNDYTRRVLRILEGLARETGPESGLAELQVSVVTGLGYDCAPQLKEFVERSTLDIELAHDVKNISKYMRAADVVFTSAGRTVFEVASLGTPMIVLAQNEREQLHTFAGDANGIVNLGLGYEISDEAIRRAFVFLAVDPLERRRRQELMLKSDLRSGVKNVLELIFAEYEKHRARAGEEDTWTS